MAARPPPRLTVFLARESADAVILRRGPTRHFQLIHWDTATDRFERGQWIVGMVYPECCDLSPDGRYVLYFAADRKREMVRALKETYTAISRPPYFTALAIWFLGSTWYGGGIFESRDHVLLHGLDGELGAGDRIDEGCPLQFSCFEGIGGTGAGQKPVEQARDAQNGWNLVSEPPHDGIWTNWFVSPRKQHPIVREKVWDGLTLTRTITRGGRYPEHALTGAALDLEDATWADWDRRGRVVFAADGRIHAATRTPRGRWQVDVLEDFAADVFEARECPEHLRSW